MDKATLHVCGPLNDDMQNLITQHDGDRYRLVLLSSQGGFAVNAAAIVDKFNRHNAQVIIDQYCFSACANIIFVASNNISVNDGAIVAFHHTSTYIYDSYERSGRTEDTGDMAAQSAAEREEYKAHGIDPTILYRIAYSTLPACVGWSANVPSHLYIVHMVNWVIPNRTEMTAIRGSFSGYWPSGLREVVANPNFKIYFKPKDILRLGLDERAPKLAPICSK